MEKLKKKEYENIEGPFENSNNIKLSEANKQEIMLKIKKERENRQQNISQIDPNEKRNLIDKILHDRRKLLSEKKPEESINNQLQSPEENWDDLVNKDVINVESEGNNTIEGQIYNNLSKINKNLVFNSDSKVPLNRSPDYQNRKKVKFDGGFNNSGELEDPKTKTQSQYFQKLKNKYGLKDQKPMTDIRRKSLEEYELLKQGYNFQPKINDYKGKFEESKEDRWNRLLNNKIEKVKQNEIIKQEKEKKDISENCTFHPEINQDFLMKNEQKLNLLSLYISILNAIAIAFYNRPVEERLHKEGMEMKLYREKLKREVYDKMVYTFKPEIEETLTHLKGEKALEKPLYQRINEVMKSKNETLQRMRFEVEDDKKLTFQPEINNKSAGIAMKKFQEEEQSKNVTERLIKDANEKFYRQGKYAENIQKEMSQTCTFNPVINPISKSNDEILQNNSFYKYQKDFVTRQYLMADNLKEKLGKKALEINKEANCNFVPKINKITQFIIEADPERADEKMKDKIERLAKKDLEKRELVQEQIAKAYYEKFNFQPEINEISKKIGRSNTIDKLANSKDNNDHKKALQEAALKAEDSKCTFRPQLKEKAQFKKITSFYKENVLENIQLEKKKKERKILEMKKVKEFEELKDCAFKPNINKKTQLSPQKDVTVKGMDKFLQMKEKKKKMELEQKQREEKIFSIEKNYNKNDHGSYTITKPFPLSKGNENKIKLMRKEVQEKTEGECTFQPKTNEANKRLMIKKILQEDNS